MITEYASNMEIQRELGQRIRNLRLYMDITQAELARRAGISLKTVGNLESGKDVSLRVLIEALRVLGVVTRLDLLVPQEEIRPSQVYYSQEVRKRAGRQAVTVREKPEWKWGDET